MSLNLPSRSHGRRQIDTSLAIVNIVLLLIFFFLIGGQDRRLQTPLHLATTRALPAQALPSPVLELRGPEDWVLDGQPITPEMAPAALAAVMGPQPGRLPVHLVMDRAAPARALMAALRRTELAGHDLRLVTQKGADP